MHSTPSSTRLLSLVLFLPLLTTAQNATRSEKRGLVYVETKHSNSDDGKLLAPWSDLTWYYNYGPNPTSSLAGSSLDFVPQLWGASEDSSDTTFIDAITQQLSDGADIKYVLGFNEPDGDQSTGGSSIPTDTAAATWMRQMAPLRTKHGLKVGLPAVTGSPNGMNWLRNFNASCEALDANGCEADFIPIHWYGNFEGLASHMGEVRATYPTLPIWITEYANAHTNLHDAQYFFNTSMEYFDRIDYVERYSYFGSFRSSESNVGSAVTMLNSKGQLTDIGSWYLGGKSTGDNPTGAAGSLKSAGTVLTIVVAGIIGLFLQVVL